MKNSKKVKINYKFKIGDYVRVVRGGWGIASPTHSFFKENEVIVKIIGLSTYRERPGYFINDLGNPFKLNHNCDGSKYKNFNCIGEESFELAKGYIDYTEIDNLIEKIETKYSSLKTQ